MPTILEEANDIINGPRQTAYGHPADNFQRIADKWSVTLGIRVTKEQVALCMVDLKTCRLVNDPKHRDSWLDIAGYVGCVDLFGTTSDELRTTKPDDVTDIQVVAAVFDVNPDLESVLDIINEHGREYSELQARYDRMVSLFGNPDEPVAGAKPGRERE